ncbi:MAG: PEP-CTERM sorting domain-containing protein [Planctomycetes bacterium]|nr:PEP-CTERM sorting domain-containing protein [Planctomycetota bacterium]
MTKYFATFACAAFVFATGGQFASASVFTGTLYYTHYTGGQNVWSVDYSYNDATHSVSLTNNQNLASVNGADGIIFAPNGNLLVGGQTNPNVHELTKTGTFVTDHSTNGEQSYHLALSPDGKTVYTSNFGGSLVSIVLAGGTTVSSVTGDDSGVTQLAFANGKVFYDVGSPNGYGNAGIYDLATNTTTRTVSGQQAVHGMVYDSYTGKITFFGAGAVGTMSAVDGSGFTQTDLGYGDFDQGSPDGKGHAFIAGHDSITFVDYSLSHDITNPDYSISIGGFYGIDDLSPLSGLGSNPVPEPSSLFVLGMCGIGLAVGACRRCRTES